MVAGSFALYRAFHGIFYEILKKRFFIFIFFSTEFSLFLFTSSEHCHSFDYQQKQQTKNEMYNTIFATSTQ